LLIRKEFHFRVKFANVDSSRFERHRMTQQTDIAIYQSTDDPHQFAFTRSDQPAGAWRLIGVYKENEFRAGLPPREVVMTELADEDVEYLLVTVHTTIRRVMVPE
jgi:hypothetical protein